jgi:hypothetical protein
MSAMLSETITALFISESDIRLAYHLNEKPSNLVSDFDELKEKIIVTRMGR